MPGQTLREIQSKATAQEAIVVVEAKLKVVAAREVEAIVAASVPLCTVDFHRREKFSHQLAAEASNPWPCEDPM